MKKIKEKEELGQKYSLKIALLYLGIWIVFAGIFFIFTFSRTKGDMVALGLILLIALFFFYIIPIWIFGLISGKLIEKIRDEKISYLKKCFYEGLVIGISFFILGIPILIFFQSREVTYFYLALVSILIIVFGLVFGKLKNKKVN